MKKMLTICAILFVAAGSTSAVVTEYTNRANWEAAVGSYKEEFFEDSTLNPEVSIVSGSGGYVSIASQRWYDVVDSSPLYQTTISFTSTIYGFGGNWDLAGPTGPGHGILVSLDGTAVNPPLTIDNSYAGGFWGVVSSTPFTDQELRGL